jgi:hypothetical protein
VNRRQRIVVDQFTPGSLVLARLCQAQPRLNVFACGTGVIARRQEINVFGATCAERTRTSGVARKVSALGQVFGIHD